MNRAHRVALQSDIYRAHRMAKIEPPAFDQMTGSDVRDMGRRMGLLPPRTHSNRNRNRRRRHG